MDNGRIITAVAANLEIAAPRVRSAVALLDAGNTIPFIARYRKEMTGSLDEEQLRAVAERLGYRRNLEDRRETILRSLDAQSVLTPELQREVHDADTLQRLEDLYRPYRPRRRTRALMARQRGLQPLAEVILAQPVTGTREAAAEPFVRGDVTSVEEAYQGARDIVAEHIADDADLRAEIRKLVGRRGELIAQQIQKAKDPKGTYQLYYSFASDLRGLRPHQVLAINRGEREGALRVLLQLPKTEALGILALRYQADAGSFLAEDLIEARIDGYNRLLFPALEREARRMLTEQAEAHAMDVFATNLRALLLQPPLRGQCVLGIDPGYRTGCKVAVVDITGKVLDTTTIYPDRKRDQAKQTLRTLVNRHDVTVIAIGNGTASRETEMLIAEMIQEGLAVRYTLVNEAGASVYSASQLARAELPDLDVSLRGAVSIARRLQDPLAELVKIDPQAIGIGLYQHDVDQRALTDTLDTVVASAVNSVGADLNTASPALLAYVSAIGPRIAENIVNLREQQGPFKDREGLLQVSGIGPKTFEQAAGFLRILEGDEALDRTGIHPESYEVAREILSLLDASIADPQLPEAIQQLRQAMDLNELARELGTGRPTLEDILEALQSPGRDPRDELEGPILRVDAATLKDLRPGMRLKGTVRNVVDFGAFVDIGVKHNGLIHISQMGKRFVRDPHDQVAVGDVVEVEILNVDMDRGRIGLSLIT